MSQTKKEGSKAAKKVTKKEVVLKEKKRKDETMKKISLWGMLVISVAAIFISAAAGTSARMLLAVLLLANGFYLGFLWMRKTTLVVLLIVCLYQAGAAFGEGYCAADWAGVLLVFPLVLVFLLELDKLLDGEDIKVTLADVDFWKVVGIFGGIAMFFTALAAFSA